MYLQQALTTADGMRHRMLGVLPGESTMSRQRLTLGYREARARRDSLFLRAGETVRGHEFHYSATDDPPAELSAYDILGGPGRTEGFVLGNVLGSYLHLHFGSDGRLAPRFVEACEQAAGLAGDRATAPSRPSTETLGAGAKAPTPASRRIPSLADEPKPPRTPTTGPGPLLRQFGLPPAEIEVLSRQRIDVTMAKRLPTTEPARGLVARLVYAAGDPALAERVALRGDPISAAVAALARGASLVVDVGMVAAGISRPSMATLNTSLQVAIQMAGADALAREHGITRAAAGILSLAAHLDGAVVAVGNAPTALLALLDLIQSGQARPAAIVAMPVGFVAAEESKEHALLADVPCIAVRGTRGGSALAAATANYLLRLAHDG
jgi:precorrin isomerase